MKLSNLPTVVDKEFEVIGLVTGLASRSVPFFYKNKPSDAKVTVKDGLSGNADPQLRTLMEAKELAFEEIVKEAKELLADEIINIKIEIGSMTSNTIEVCICGTAIKYKA